MSSFSKIKHICYGETDFIKHFPSIFISRSTKNLRVFTETNIDDYSVLGSCYFFESYSTAPFPTIYNMLDDYENEQDEYTLVCSCIKQVEYV